MRAQEKGFSNGLIVSIIMLMLLSVSFALNGQQSGIQGLILDKISGQPVPDAEVSLEGKKKGSISDRYGMFYCKSLEAGSYTLQITHLGYETYKQDLTLAAGEQRKIQVSLTPRIREVMPVEIRDQAIERVPYIKDFVLREKIERTSARDIGDFIRTEPNVAAVRKGGIALDPVIRGFRFSQLNVQADYGLKIEGGCPNRMDPTAAHIEIEEIEKIEIIKGPYALRYGPAMGGVMNMITSAPHPYDDFTLEVHGIKGYESNWNGDKEYLRLRGGDERYFFQLSGSKKQYGNYTDGNGDVILTEFKRYSYKAQAGFIPLKGHEVLFSWENSKGENVKFPALPMDERVDDTKLYSLDYKVKDLGKVLHSLDLKVYRSDVYHQMDNKERPFSDTVAAVSTLETYNQGFRLQGGFTLGTANLIAGVDMEDVYKDGDRIKNLIAQPTYPIFTEQLWNEASITNLGLFAEYRKSWNLTELIAALRVDQNSANSSDISVMKMMNEIYASTDNASDYTNISFSAGLSRKLTEAMKLSLSAGRGVRSPDMLERFIILLPIGYDRFDYLGNPKLEPEANHQFDLTLEYAHPALGSVKGNVFYSYITNYITGKRIPPADQVPLTADVSGVKQFYNAENATLSGFELSYQSPASLPLKVLFTAAYTQGVLGEAISYVKNESGQITGEVELDDDPMPEIPPFEANLHLAWPLNGGQWVPRASLRMVAEQSRISASYEEDATPGFTVIDLALSYRFNDYLQFSGGVNNVLDEAYYEHLNRRIIGSKSNFYEPGRIFFVNMIVNL